LGLRQSLRLVTSLSDRLFLERNTAPKWWILAISQMVEHIKIPLMTAPTLATQPEFENPDRTLETQCSSHELRAGVLRLI
jgi:hypothetical protein